MATKQDSTKTEEVAQITLRRVQRETLEIPIIGTSPLIVHNWSKKAKEMILAKQQGKKIPKEHRDPEQEFLDSMYRLEDEPPGGLGHGFPATGFKLATVSGAREFKGAVTMKALLPMLYFVPEDFGYGGESNGGFTRITGSEPVPREDLVRIGMGTADLRYRAEYTQWGATLLVQYNPQLIDRESVYALVDAGGRNGVGEWRPEKGGVYGTYQIQEG